MKLNLLWHSFVISGAYALFKEVFYKSVPSIAYNLYGFIASYMFAIVSILTRVFYLEFIFNYTRNFTVL